MGQFACQGSKLLFLSVLGPHLILAVLQTDLQQCCTNWNRLFDLRLAELPGH